MQKDSIHLKILAWVVPLLVVLALMIPLSVIIRGDIAHDNQAILQESPTPLSSGGSDEGEGFPVDIEG